MVPLVASNAIPTPPPVINTMLPGATIAHVPYDNVAPSVSSAEINNNASNNNTPPPAPETAPENALSVDEAFTTYLTNAGPALNINAQATFLAQLIGQDVTVPPETAGILVQYEKLNAFANVKYKPSNAQKPEAGPSNAFSRLLQEENTAPATPSASATVAAKAPVTLEQAQAQAVPAVRLVVSKAAKGAGAYAASAGRVAANSNTVAELA